jgi:hypothetical protein
VDRLGEYMFERGLITREQLGRALHVQRRDGGRIGLILSGHGACTRADADRAWVDMMVREPLAAAVEILSGGSFSSFPDRDIRFLGVLRRDVIVEDMLDNAHLREHENQIEGTAELVVGDRTSLPVSFTIDARAGAAALDENSENIVRRWTALIARSPSKQPPVVNPSVPEAFEAQVEALLRDTEQAA